MAARSFHELAYGIQIAVLEPRRRHDQIPPVWSFLTEKQTKETELPLLARKVAHQLTEFLYVDLHSTARSVFAAAIIFAASHRNADPIVR
jgi:hypothetical protein